MRYAKAVLSSAFLIGLFLWPGTAMNAARGAIYTWLTAVAPAMFPFMAVLPLLTCYDSRTVYEKLLGWIMKPVFGLPGAAAPVLIIGLVAGSPAGSAAVRRISVGGEFNIGQLKRLALCMVGLNPAYLISGVGGGLLGSESLGSALARSQILAQLALLFILRFIYRGGEIVNPLQTELVEDENGTVKNALSAVIGVCGNMMLFSVITALLSMMLGQNMGTIAAFILDFPTGAKELTSNGYPIILLAALTGFTGMCISRQNMAILSQIGIKWKEYILIRMAASIMCALFFAIQTDTSRLIRIQYDSREIYVISLLIAVIIIIPILARFIICSFFNKRKFIRTSE